MKLIIVGSARCVWDDLEKLLPMECDVMAINDMIGKTVIMCYSSFYEHREIR